MDGHKLARQVEGIRDQLSHYRVTQGESLATPPNLVLVLDDDRVFCRKLQKFAFSYRLEIYRCLSVTDFWLQLVAKPTHVAAVVMDFRKMAPLVQGMQLDLPLALPAVVTSNKQRSLKSMSDLPFTPVHFVHRGEGISQLLSTINHNCMPSLPMTPPSVAPAYGRS